MPSPVRGQVQNPSLIACHETDGECGLQRGKAINQAGWGLHMPSYKVKRPEKIIRIKNKNKKLGQGDAKNIKIRMQSWNRYKP